MKLRFEWQEPIKLTKNKKIIVSDGEMEMIEDVPGVYYFARAFGTNSHPFYIGETGTLRRRLKRHLESARIKDILRGMAVKGAPEIANGGRYFHFAYFIPGKGQRPNTACGIAQKMMIRKAVAENLPLLNKQYTVIKTDVVTFPKSPRHTHYFEGDFEVEDQ